jgi:hypothetical protein
MVNEKLNFSKWCKNVLEETIAIHGKPEIVNIDHCCHNISALWTHYLKMQLIIIFMVAKGRVLETIELCLS